MDALLAERGEARASDIVARLGGLLEELLAEAAPRWETHELLLGGPGGSQLALTVPLLKLDPRAIERNRVRLAPGPPI